MTKNIKNIKNFIEEGEKEFDKRWWDDDDGIISGLENGIPVLAVDCEELKQFISSRQISLTAFLIKMIVEDTMSQIQNDLNGGKFYLICSNETTFKNYVRGVLSNLTDGK